MATRQNRWYVSLAEAKQSDLYGLASVTSEDERVKTAIRRTSALIETALDTWFYPVLATRYFDHPAVPSVLELDQWLLSIDTDGFTTDNTDETVETTDYFLARTLQNPIYEAPYRLVLMNPDGDYSELEWSDTEFRANAITGAWGYNDDTAATGATVLNDPLAVGGLSLTVLTGTMEVGWMLLVETEQIFVSSITTGDPNDTVTIVRAQDGTTAAAHVATTAISRYVPPYDIELLTGILAARLYHRGTTGWSDIIGSKDSAQQFVKAMAPEAAYILDLYGLETWGSGGWVTWKVLDG